MKTKYILHGGISSKDNESNRAFYEEFVRDVSDGSNVLLVFFAVESEDVAEKAEYMQGAFEKQSHGTKLNFMVATREDFLDQVKKADAIYIHGGNTEQLIEILKSYPNLKSYLGGKTIAGSSAGAYALAQFGSAHTSERMREGLGVLPIRIICHDGSLILPPSATSVAELRATAPELELVILKDYEWKVFE